MPGEVTVSNANGFARLLFRFAREVQAKAEVTGSILLVTFTEPVDLDVERLSAGAPDYLSAARRDPDGLAVRIALVRKVQPNLISVGERLFVDLLPEGWKGVKPGLPQDVVEELARRIRVAEKKARIGQQLGEAKKIAPVRVRVASQPTFTRYLFPLPGAVAVTADRTRDGLTLVFDARLRFDLADAIAALPSQVRAIESKLKEDEAAVHFAFAGKVDVRTFREDKDYVVDVADISEPKSQADPISRMLDGDRRPASPVASEPNLERRPPDTVPAAPAPSTVPQANPPQPAAAAPGPEPAAAPAPPASPAKAAVAVPPSSLSGQAEVGKAVPEQSPESAPPAAPGPSQKTTSLRVEVKRDDNLVRLFFPFTKPTPAAVFRRADMVWLVFDTDAELDLAAVQPNPKALIRAVQMRRGDGIVLRLKLDRPRMSSLAMEGAGWALTLSDAAAEPIESILLNRSISGPNRATIIFPFADGQRLHRLNDPEVGDTLMVVTALGPVRGVLKSHDFVEFRALPSTQGIVVQPLADDILIQLMPERVVVSRPGGLTLSPHVTEVPRPGAVGATMFDIQQWGRNSTGSFFAQQSQLIDAAVAASPEQQTTVHVNLARFYLARGMYYEAKAAMDVAIASERAKANQSSNYVMRAVAEVMSHRPAEALKDLAHGSVGNQHDAQLWRAMAYAQQHKWAAARAGFRAAQMSLGTLPIELQRYGLLLSVRVALEIGDVEAAGNQLNDFETIGAPPQLEAKLGILRGRVAEKLGHIGKAAADYESVTGSTDRQAATEARLRLAALRIGNGELKRKDAIAELETLSVIWRGDNTEIETLQLLARLYTQEHRIRDALGAMRAAMAVNSHSEVTRHIQDEAAATFESLFLSGQGAALPAVDALSLFYDFRDLTPMGRRGDEMIRRLAERLVSVDLLDQAAELLQHQIDHRLEGAARAQVAARLALIYLMNHKADRALAALRATHIAGLSNTMRNRRLLIESRALSELKRPDVALEIIANIDSPEANRQRADVLWKAGRWRLAAEQLERMLGSRWRDWQPLDALERTEVLRAGIGYVLGEDAIGLDRLRQRYSAKMTSGPDSRAFDVVTAPTGFGSAEFRSVVSTVGSVDTLDAFVRDMRAGLPDPGPSPSPIAEAGNPPGAPMPDAAPAPAADKRPQS